MLQRRERTDSIYALLYSLIGGSGRRNKRRLTRKAMNTVEQSGTGFDLLFWYVLRKEKARQGCMADFKFFEKP